ncbi:hypothetical protein chiPu_0031946, partial [Chiloscyllium punctatum]|nr:hypothetical protein [Chiloscyllium punctatum]
MYFQRGIDRGALAQQAGIVDAGAAAGPARAAPAHQCRAQRRGHRGVGDSHLADHEQIALLRHRAPPGVERDQEVGAIHRRRHREIAGRPREFERLDAQFGAGELGDLVDRGTACGEVRHHLRGDLGGKGRDAALGDAMIAGEHGDRHVVEPGEFAPLPARQPDRDLLQP